MKARKLIYGAIVALIVAGGLTAWALSRRDYRVYWTAADGTVIGGITSVGRLDTLAGANIGGALSVTGALSFTGNLALGTKFTVDSTTGNTVIAGTLGVTGLTTLTGGLTVPTGKAVTLVGNTTLTVGTGTVTLGGALNVTGAAVLGGAVTVTGETELLSTLGVVGNVDIGQTASRTFTITAASGDVELLGAISIGSYIVLGTSATPQTPSAGTMVLWFDGTDLRARNEAGETVNITNGAWNGD